MSDISIKEFLPPMSGRAEKILDEWRKEEEEFRKDPEKVKAEWKKKGYEMSIGGKK